MIEVANPKVAWQIFSLEVRKIMSYRVDFWINFIGTVFVELTIAYFLWRAVFDFRGVQEISGYSFLGLMLYYLLVPLLGSIVKGPEMHFISTDIYDGSLTRYLIYPISFFQYKLLSQYAYALIAILKLILALVLFIALFGTGDIKMSFGNVCLAVFTCLISLNLFFLIAAAIELGAFWADAVWSISVMLRFCINLLGGILLPLAMFPEWAQTVMRSLPFYYLIAFPIEIALGKVSFTNWLFGLGMIGFWTIVAAFAYSAVWRRGSYIYTGVGQ